MDRVRGGAFCRPYSSVKCSRRHYYYSKVTRPVFHLSFMDEAGATIWNPSVPDPAKNHPNGHPIAPITSLQS